MSLGAYAAAACTLWLVQVACAAGGSKTTTFALEGFGVAAYAKVDVTLSWDDDVLRPGEIRHFGLAISAYEVRSDFFDNLDISVAYVTLRAESVAEAQLDLAGQITWIYSKSLTTPLSMSQPRYFDMDLEVPDLTTEGSAKVYYLVHLEGEGHNKRIALGDGAFLGEGDFTLYPNVLSNSAEMWGIAVEDPVWMSIDIPEEESRAPPWLLVVVLLGVLAATGWLYAFWKRGRPST